MIKRLYVLICLAAAASAAAAPVKKLIECSWSNPTTDQLRENITLLEARVPYQGLRIFLTGRGEGKGQNHKTIFGKVRWKYEWFRLDVENLKNTKFNRFTDNFLSTGVVPGNVDWFSDSDWETVCQNFGLVARIARETGLRGLIFDPEEYSGHLWEKIQVQNHTLEEIAAKARQRGQEFGKAIFNAYPDLTLFCFSWMAVAKDRPVFCGFVNGIYDVLPSGAKIVDGDESGGYSTKDAASLHARVNELKKAASFLDPANRAKYFLQTSYSPAIYLEGVLPIYSDSTWYQTVRRGFGTLSTLEFLRRHLENCLAVSDEYVWTDSERRSWTGIRGWESRLWEKWAPGITAAFLAAQDPIGHARKEIAAKKTANLLKNPRFAKGNGNLPTGWGMWQGRYSNGSVEFRDGVSGVFFRNASDTNLSQLIPLVPNKRYLLRLRGKVARGPLAPAVSMSANLTWRFSLKERAWLISNRMSLVLPPTGKKETAEKVFIAPAEASNLFLSIKVKNQNNSGDSALLESCELFPLEDFSDSPKAILPTLRKSPAKKLPGSDPSAAGMTISGGNLLANPEFTAPQAKTRIPQWTFWQNKNSRGTFLAEPVPGGQGFKGKVRNALGVSIYQFVKIVPGSCYELRLSCESEDPVYLAAHWGNEQKRWTLPKENRSVECRPDATSRTAVLRVKAPEKAAYLALKITGSGTISLIKAEVYRLR